MGTPKKFTLSLTAQQVQEALLSVNNKLDNSALVQNLLNPSNTSVPSTQAVVNALDVISGDFSSLGELSTLDAVGLGTDKVTGILPISKGGTGATSAVSARATLGVMSQQEIQDLVANTSDQDLSLILQIMATNSGYDEWAGFFVDGFEVTQQKSVALDGDGIFWEYIGTNIPYTVSAGTNPSTNVNFTKVEILTESNLLEKDLESFGLTKKGYFKLGFNYENEKDVGVYNNKAYIYIGGDPLPVSVSVDTNPEDFPLLYKEVSKTSASNIKFLDDKNLESYRSETDNALKAMLIAQGLSGNFGFFADGFAYNLVGDVGIDTDGKIYTYAGSDPLPVNVTAGTNPVGDSDYKIWNLDSFNIREMEISDIIAEDAPVGTRYRVSDLLDARYDVVDISDSGGWYISINAAKKLRYIPTLFVFAEHLGCKNDGSTDCSSAVNYAIENYSICDFNGGDYLFEADINYKSKISLNGRAGKVKFLIGAEGINLLNVFECLYTVTRDIDIEFAVKNATAIKMHSDGGSSTQLNKFYNVNVEGGSRSGTTSVLLESVAFSNQFYSCNFFRTETGVVFGEVGIAANAVNANHFYGCEVRAVNSTVGARPVIHRGGDNNGFFGGIIENWNLPIDMQGGTLFLDKVYLEAFNSANCISMNGGSLSVTGCFRVPFVFIYGGESFNFTGNQLLDSSNLTSNTYPLVQNRADHNCRITVRDNQQESTLYLYRKNQWRDGAALWQDKTRKDDVFDYIKTNIKYLLSSTSVNVTGDGTQFIVPFDYPINNSGTGAFASGVYTPEYNQTVQVDVACYLEGATASACNLVQVELLSGSEVISIFTGGIESETPSGRRLYRGTAKGNLKIGETLSVRVTLSGGAKTVSVVGNPTSEITYISITEIV